MIDITDLRNNPQKYIDLIAKGRGDAKRADISKWLKLDTQRNELIKKINKKRNKRNELSKGLKGKPSPEIINEVKRVKVEVEELETKLSQIEEEWKEILDWIPNLPLDEVPDGVSELNNVEIKAWNPEIGYFDETMLEGCDGSSKFMNDQGSHQDEMFKTLPHWEVADNLKIVDLQAGAKASGSRFYYLSGDGVLLFEAVVQLMWQKLLSEGFIPLYSPLLVRESVLYGSSHFPGDADQVYKIESKNIEDSNDLYLVGSSEPSNFAKFMNKTLNLDDLPIKLMARSTCFRSEAGSWGKDVRGIKRAHQFEKLEMNIICKNDLEESRKMHEYLLSLNEWLLQELKIPYHVINMCIGDLGYYAAAKKYDIEFWTPSQKCFTEIMSNSITTDYQSRRLNIKYKNENNELSFVHTLNDTAVTHRILIAIIEHYQQSDGSIKVPEALQSYIKKEFIFKNKL
ncbi:MAG: serine--tRNA ligase [Candidatus Dojkabacteria bacterium]|nr:MAG: serine--tRNA ligase [Candidatus Dojkabacteria bacterium]